MVYLVGAGPGEPKLSTLRAKELIESCDVLVFDNLANPEPKMDRKECIQIDVGNLVGTLSNKEISKNLLNMPPWKHGRSFERWRPFVFGRCAEEMLALDKADIVYEVVPG